VLPLSVAKHSEYFGDKAPYLAPPIWSSSYWTTAVAAVLRFANAESSSPVLNIPMTSVSARLMIRMLTRSSTSVAPDCAWRRSRGHHLGGRRIT
jgi:hypothetical protein